MADTVSHSHRAPISHSFTQSSPHELVTEQAVSQRMWHNPGGQAWPMATGVEAGVRVGGAIVVERRGAARSTSGRIGHTCGGGPGNPGALHELRCGAVRIEPEPRNGAGGVQIVPLSEDLIRDVPAAPVQPALTPPTPTPIPAPAPASSNCDPSYPTLCLPSFPDLDRGEIGDRRFPVIPPDSHGFDGDFDGVGCESG
jgi:hypothetical protein